MSITLRKATPLDMKFLFELRNDAAVRAASFIADTISFEAHKNWFEKRLKDAGTALYIAETEGKPAAQIRFDCVGSDGAEVNVAVVQAHRGRGLGSDLLRKASSRFFEEHPRIARIHALIKTGNEASLRSFKKAGYAFFRGTMRKNERAVELLLCRVHCLRIGEKTIGPRQPCFVVAELSGNHHGNYEEAVALMKAAKEAGADAVKLQTYTPDTMTLNSNRKWFRVGGTGNPKNWKGKTLYQLYQETYTPWEWQPKLKKLADELDIILFSTPFDETAVDFLEEMNVPCYKIASYEATDFVLLRKVAETGKPVIISFGYSSEEEIRFTLETLRRFGAKDIAALHCVTGYAEKPTAEDMRLSNITDLQKRFGVVSGFSDNNAGIEIPLMAVASGASIIEKHLTLERDKGGPDARFSLEPSELTELISRIRALESGAETVVVPRAVFGTPCYGPTSQIEAYNKRWRRSLFSGKDIQKGDIFTKENVRDVRPAFGLETKYYDEVIGKRAALDIPFATPLSWGLIS